MESSPANGPLPSGNSKTKVMSWRLRAVALAYGALFVLVTTAVLSVRWPLSERFALAVGDVSPADIRAPRYIEYISASRTEAARLDAERRVADVYEPQRRARSDQVKRSQEVLSFIESVRGDAFASEEDKLAYLEAVPELQLSAEDGQRILAMDEEAWQRVRQQVPEALSRLMLGEIRDNQLAVAKRTAPTYIDLAADDEAQAAAVLVQGLLRPTMVYNAERSEALRQEARSTVPPQIDDYEQNEIIVRQGDIISERHVEALEALGLNGPNWEWWQLATAFVLALFAAMLFGLYIARQGSPNWLQRRQLGLLIALLIAFLLLAKLMVPGHTLLPYVFPLAALTMLVGPLLGLPLALLVTLFFAMIVAYLSDDPLTLVIYCIVGPVAGALVLDRAERTSAFLTTGAVISLVNLLVLLVMNLPPGEMDFTGYLQLAAVALINGSLAASLTLIGFYGLGALFDIATPLRLMEISRPNHPLLRDLITKAPGTYHHSLLVSNLAEQAAQAIGADAFLTRVGAYYHDVGKLLHPYFFVENRLEEASPHDQLDPWSSAQIIISHVKDGLELARRHKLPHRIQDFIAEHHGTTLVRFFHHEAVKLAGEGQVVDEKDFRYAGPRPQSKETALLMLADGCESATRATHPDTREGIEEIVRKIVNQRLMDGELSASDLTLRDLEIVQQVFVRSLQGIHHPRVKYPEVKPQPAALPTHEQPPEPATVS